MTTMTLTLDDINRLAAQLETRPEAFTPIYRQYFSPVYNYARYRLGDAGAADDITAQTFERVLNRIGSFDPQRGTFEAWLFTIARNLVNDHLRRSQRRHWFSLDAIKERSSDQPGPEQQVIRKQQQAELLAAVARLDEHERDIIALKFASGFSNRDIAAMTGLSASNVGVILYRAVKKLKQTLVSKEDHDND